MEKKDKIEILLEDMQSKFELVLEGHDALRNEIARTAHQTHDKIDLVEEKILILNQKIDAVKSDLTARIDQVETKIETAKTELSTRIDQVETKLSTRIDQVETRLSSKIDAVAADLAAHRADTETHRAPYRVSEPAK